MRTKVLCIIVLIICSLSACMDDEGYSLDNFRVDFGIVTEESTDEFIIVLDDDSRLYPVAGFIPRQIQEDGERVLVDFTILGDKKITESQKEYFVKINSIGKILKKGIMDIVPAIEDSIGSDPVIIRDVWVSKNQLLNFRIKYYGNNKVHFINLVKKPGKLNVQSQPVQLELRHNRNKDREIYPMTAFVSFELDSLRISGLDSVRFEVRSEDYDEELHTFEGVFHYK